MPNNFFLISTSNQGMFNFDFTSPFIPTTLQLPLSQNTLRKVEDCVSQKKIFQCLSLYIYLYIYAGATGIFSAACAKYMFILIFIALYYAFQCISKIHKTFIKIYFIKICPRSYSSYFKNNF